jgi:hypothetical protein
MYSIRQIGQDILNVIRGLNAFARYLRAMTDCQVGLSLLSAASSAVREGQSNRYVVRIANAGRQLLVCRLALEISALTAGRPPAPRCAQLIKSLTLAPRAGATVAIDYDWADQACCCIDGTCSSPDALWRDSLDRPQLYAVTALLYDLDERRLDALTVYQELTG